MRHSSGVTGRGQGFGLGEDKRGRWRRRGASAVQNGAAAELGCDACVQAPSCRPSAPWAPGSSSAVWHARAQPDRNGGGERKRRLPRAGEQQDRALRGDAGARCNPKREACSEVAKLLRLRGLTFDMSGSRRQAQPAGGCPLDGGVRRQAPHARGSRGLRETRGPFAWQGVRRSLWKVFASVQRPHRTT